MKDLRKPEKAIIRTRNKTKNQVGLKPPFAIKLDEGITDYLDILFMYFPESKVPESFKQKFIYIYKKFLML